VLSPVVVTCRTASGSGVEDGRGGCQPHPEATACRLLPSPAAAPQLAHSPCTAARRAHSAAGTGRKLQASCSAMLCRPLQAAQVMPSAGTRRGRKASTRMCAGFSVPPKSGSHEGQTTSHLSGRADSRPVTSSRLLGRSILVASPTGIGRDGKESAGFVLGSAVQGIAGGTSGDICRDTQGLVGIDTDQRRVFGPSRDSHEGQTTTSLPSTASTA
jgi:hypothetical protein